VQLGRTTRSCPHRSTGAVAEGLSPRYDSNRSVDQPRGPDFEPSDEDLEGISRRAFARVRSEHEHALEKLRAEIVSVRADVLLRLARAEKTT
jgi:hypothetical protein